MPEIILSQYPVSIRKELLTRKLERDSQRDSRRGGHASNE